MTSPATATGATPAPRYLCDRCGRRLTAAQALLAHVSDPGARRPAICPGIPQPIAAVAIVTPPPGVAPMKFRGWKDWVFARSSVVRRENRPAERIRGVDSLPPGAEADMRHARRQQRADDVSAIEACAIEAAFFRKRAVRP